MDEPDVSEICVGMFRDFAEWRGWLIPETAAFNPAAYKGAECWDVMLKSQMVRSDSRPDGLPPDEAILKWLPDHGLPPRRDAWQKEKKAAKTIELRQWVPFTVLDCDQLIRACQRTTWPKCPSGQVSVYEIWCCVWSLIWIFGISMEGLLTMRVSAIDFDQWGCGTITNTRKKNGVPVGPLPIPSIILPLLKKLVHVATDLNREAVFAFPENIFVGGQDGSQKSTERVYTRVRPMYARAGLKPRSIGGQNKWFHTWRAVAVTRWKNLCPSWQEYITGHSPSSISDGHYASPEKEVLIPLIEAYEMPEALIELVQELQHDASADSESSEQQ